MPAASSAVSTTGSSIWRIFTASVFRRSAPGPVPVSYSRFQSMNVVSMRRGSWVSISRASDRRMTSLSPGAAAPRSSEDTVAPEDPPRGTNLILYPCWIASNGQHAWSGSSAARMAAVAVMR